MGYYIRVLSTSQECVPQELLESALHLSPNPAELERIDPVENSCWKQIILRHAGGHEIAYLERDLVEPNSLGEEELEDFQEDIADCKPVSAATWVADYLKKVRCIYSFQVLDGAYHNDGWESLYLIRGVIFGFAPAIGQADGEGFTNEQEDHILWQFEDDSSELWDMAVLRNGKWVSFEMDLGNEQQRDAFLRGEAPVGVVTHSPDED
jgi:hypothetical protein